MKFCMGTDEWSIILSCLVAAVTFAFKAFPGDIWPNGLWDYDH